MNSKSLIASVFFHSMIILILSKGLLAVADSNMSRMELEKWHNESQYAIEIPITTQNIEKLKSHLHAYSYMLVYIPTSNTENTHLKIGFFKNIEIAKTFKEASDFIVDSQRIIKISEQERSSVLSSINNSTDQKYDFYVYRVGQEMVSQSAIIARQSLDKAKQLYLSGQYDAAINHYRLLIMFADNDTAAWANELIGICQEKLHKPKLAIQTYKQLLESYPQSNGVARIKQRLRSLETANLDQNSNLRNTNQEQHQTQTRGILGQYYRTLSRQINDAPSEETLSLLSTDFDIRSSIQLQNHNIQTRLNGFTLKDNLNEANNLTRISRFYIDYQHLQSNIQAVLGRQKKFSSGVFTSFDGATINYPLKDNLHLAASMGKPIYFYDIYENLDYFFYSTQIKWDITDQWLLNSYYIDQSLNGITDRQALGIQTQFNNSRLSSSLNIDYDVAFAEMNNVALTGGYNINSAINVTATLGQQRSPFLTATNILIGQPDLNLSFYLQSKENKDNLLENALARTALNDYRSFTISGKISSRLQLILDYYDSTLSEIPNNEILFGLPNTPTQDDSFNQTHIGAQIIIQNILFQQESSIIGWQKNDASYSSSSQYFINEKIRISHFWSIGARGIYSDIQYSLNDNTQTQLRYSLQIDIRPFRNTEFTIEAGNEDINADQTNTQLSSTYIFAGYRVNF